MLSDPPPMQPPSRRDGGLVLWVICGVLIFAVMSAVTLVVLVRNPPPAPSAVTRTPTAVVTATPPHFPTTPTPRLLAKAADSPLTRVQLTNTTCPDVSIARHKVRGSQLEPYLDSLIDCLMDVHAEPFEAAGLSLSRPALMPESEVEDSGCVTDHREPLDWAGLYCGANATIYYHTDWSPSDPMHYLEVITHEFAHHLQRESDILARVSREQHAAEKEPHGAARALELTRRLELQAECLSGIALGPNGPLAVRTSEFAVLLEQRSAVPPEWATSHGTGRAQTRWFKAGAEATGQDRMAVCNTFTAPESLVE